MPWIYAIPGSSAEMFTAIETYFKLGALTVATPLPVVRVTSSTAVVPLGPGDIAFGDASPGNPALFNLGRIVFTGTGLTAGTLDMGGGATVPGLTGGTITGIRYYFNDLLSASITQGLPYDPAMSLETNLRLSAAISLPNVSAVALSTALIQTYQQDNPAILRAFFSSFQHVMQGNDNVNLMAAYDGNDVLIGAGGNDFLQGEGGNDTLDGGAGTDGLHGGPGSDLYLPGPPDPTTPVGDAITDNGTNPADIDTLSYANATGPVTVDLNPLDGDQSSGWARGLLASGIERVVGSVFDDTLIGADFPASITDTPADTLEGNFGDDTLYGLSGSDLLIGGRGFDVLIGGPNGEIRGPGPGDVAAFNAFSGEIDVFFRNDGSVQVAAPGEGIDTLFEVEFLGLNDGIFNIGNFAGSARAVMAGDGAGNRLTGTPASDLIYGRAGADTVTGGGGNDRIEGGIANDRLQADGFFAQYAPDLAAQIYRLYQATLDRAPDVGGHGDWVARMLEGTTTLQQAAAGFVNSAEFQQAYGALTTPQFVEQLYQNVLNRAADAGGLASWVGQLDGGATRAQVVLGFSESPEFVSNTAAEAARFTRDSDPASWSDEVFRAYHATLDRNPDLGGFIGWIEQLASGTPLVNTISGFVASTEFQQTYGPLSNPQFVQQLYQNVLNRAADAGGLASWVGQLDSGTNRAQVVLGFSESPEFVSNMAQPLAAWVRGLGSDDVLSGGPGNDLLAGGRLADVFLFGPGEGHDIVADLETWDTLIFRGFGYTTDATIRSHMTQADADVLFSDQGTELRLLNAQLGLISDDMIAV